MKSIAIIGCWGASGFRSLILDGRNGKHKFEHLRTVMLKGCTDMESFAFRHAGAETLSVIVDKCVRYANDR